MFYDIKTDKPIKIKTLDVLKLIKESGNPGFIPYAGDQISDLRLIRD